MTLFSTNADLSQAGSTTHIRWSRGSLEFRGMRPWDSLGLGSKGQTWFLLFLWFQQSCSPSQASVHPSVEQRFYQGWREITVTRLGTILQHPNSGTIFESYIYILKDSKSQTKLSKYSSQVYTSRVGGKLSQILRSVLPSSREGEQASERCTWHPERQLPS